MILHGNPLVPIVMLIIAAGPCLTNVAEAGNFNGILLDGESRYCGIKTWQKRDYGGGIKLVQPVYHQCRSIGSRPHPKLQDQYSELPPTIIDSLAIISHVYSSGLLEGEVSRFPRFKSDLACRRYSLDKIPYETPNEFSKWIPCAEKELRFRVQLVQTNPITRRAQELFSILDQGDLNNAEFRISVVKTLFLIRHVPPGVLKFSDVLRSLRGGSKYKQLLNPQSEQLEFAFEKSSISSLRFTATARSSFHGYKGANYQVSLQITDGKIINLTHPFKLSAEACHFNRFLQRVEPASHSFGFSESIFPDGNVADLAGTQWHVASRVGFEAEDSWICFVIQESENSPPEILAHESRAKKRGCENC